MSLQIQTEEAFLKFVTSINLGEYVNAVFEVAGEITGTFRDSSIEPTHKAVKPSKSTFQ